MIAKVTCPACGAERKIQILTLKLAIERAVAVLDSGYGEATAKASDAAAAAQDRLDALNLTAEERAL